MTERPVINLDMWEFRVSNYQPRQHPLPQQTQTGLGGQVVRCAGEGEVDHLQQGQPGQLIDQIVVDRHPVEASAWAARGLSV